MCTDGDEADITVALSVRFVIPADHCKSSILTRCARVRLERAGVEASDFAEIVLKLVDQLVIPLHLVDRREGMDRTKLGPSERDHRARAIELHGAASEGNHSMHER